MALLWNRYGLIVFIVHLCYNSPSSRSQKARFFGIKTKQPLVKIPKIFKKKERRNLALSLDIGTEFIKALIFEIDTKTQKGKVIGVGKQRQGLGDMQSGAVADISGVVKNCEEAISRAEEMAEAAADQAIIGIAGELVKGKTISVHYERKDPQEKIDLPELKNIIHKVQWKAFERVRKQLSWETGLSEIDVKLINAAIVDVKIDGYKITNPLGFQGKDVTISIFNAYAPLIHLGALQTIANEVGLDLLSIAAEPYAVARSIGSADSQEFSAIFIDIGGGTTDIAVVNKGGIEGTKMFALGGRAFTKRIAQELDIPFEEAERMKLKYSNKQLPDGEMKKVRDALAGDVEVWLAGVELALSEFSDLEILPQRVLLCGGGSNLPEIKEVLSKSDWTENLPFSKKPSVNFLKPDDVANVVDATEKLNSVQDITPMALAHLALDLAGEETMTQTILRRVVKMMQT